MDLPRTPRATDTSPARPSVAPASPHGTPTVPQLGMAARGAR
jgi:hypothetical protein